MSRYLEITLPTLMGKKPFYSLFQDMERNTDLYRNTTSGYPLTDIYVDDEENQVIEMALAGFSKEQLNISVESNTITVESDGIGKDAGGSKLKASDNLTYTNKRNISKRSFSKTYVDYDNILDFSDVEASFENGLLKLVIPRKKQSRSKKVLIK